MSEEIARTFGVEAVEGGYRVAVREGMVIEIWLMLFNWRLVCFEKGNQVSVAHGFCFFGRSMDTFARALAAAREWEHPLTEKPSDYDKQAF